MTLAACRLPIGLTVLAACRERHDVVEVCSHTEADVGIADLAAVACPAENAKPAPPVCDCCCAA